MGESSDIQSTVTRTSETGRMQNLASEQEEMRRKRLELERTREIAERAKKVAEAESAAGRRPVEDRWDDDSKRRDPNQVPGEGDPPPETKKAEPVPGKPGEFEGGIDVRV